jgi:hypothetical protein
VSRLALFHDLCQACDAVPQPPERRAGPHATLGVDHWAPAGIVRVPRTAREAFPAAPRTCSWNVPCQQTAWAEVHPGQLLLLHPSPSSACLDSTSPASAPDPAARSAPTDRPPLPEDERPSAICLPPENPTGRGFWSASRPACAAAVTHRLRVARKRTVDRAMRRSSVRVSAGSPTPPFHRDPGDLNSDREICFQG